jgi:hypothetical protein
MRVGKHSSYKHSDNLPDIVTVQPETTTERLVGKPVKRF